MMPVTSSASTKTWVICRSPWMNTGGRGSSAPRAISRLRTTSSEGSGECASSHSHSFSSSASTSASGRPGHGGNGASWSRRIIRPAAAHAAGDASDGAPSTPSAAPGTAERASVGGSCHSTSGVGIGARCIARTSVARRVGCPSIFTNTSPARSVARSSCATTTST